MNRIYFIFAILAGVMFGSTGVFVRTLTESGIDSTTLLFLRFSIAIIVLLLAILFTNKSLIKAKLSDFPLFILSGICIVGLNLCYNNSINLVSLSLAAVLLSTAPIFVFIFAYLLFREKITFKKIFCLSLAILGCILASGLLEFSIESISVFGIVCGVGAAVFWAFYMMVSKKSIDNGNHTYTILLYALIFLAIVLIPFTNFSQINNFISPNIILMIAFLFLHSAVSFALPYIFITVALNYIDSGVASIFTSASEPLSALVYGLLIYGEVPSFLMFAGFVLTILAIIILSLKKEIVRS